MDKRKKKNMEDYKEEKEKAVNAMIDLVKEGTNEVDIHRYIRISARSIGSLFSYSPIKVAEEIRNEVFS